MVKRLFADAITQGVVIVIFATATAIYGLLKSYWNWPTAIVYGILLVCALWWLKDRLELGQPALRDRIREWLDKGGFSVQNIVDNTSVFHFVLTDNAYLRINVFQVANTKQLTIAAFALSATSYQKDSYGRLSAQEQRDFWKRVRLELLRYGIGYNSLTLDGVTLFALMVASKSLTDVDFMNRVRFVWGGARLYGELLTELSGPTPSTSHTEPPQPLPST